MNEFGFLSATLTVFYQTGVDEFNEPVIKSSTFRNVALNATAQQLHNVATTIVGLTDYDYIESVKTQKESVTA
ncbi:MULTISPECIES: DUF1659 domain-containing protein [Solibacillus]|uniref:DUF1659 domain-containing protein n=1 Tax=Solibacillus merdavium TaxID=2762218 RepID=A0ABR8XLZ4_9BACL|nr:DUF1659 domain-containing protein [Solibacillus merdavium]MBD8032934.1 DUF1659 domain-containing protein [Solibacillus merdavium]